ncbi:MAG: GNAT family N-acetyltransferase [Clostridium sp.]|nr:GNAT family N-acetyltransferase [Clostridium sp.]MCM1208491.1 GNAT family N-acetyltransferase [Ruminococcus sp.]
MIYEVTGTKEIKDLFATSKETMVWSCIQGVMGHLYADSPDNPQSAMAVLGDFCFFAGTPNIELILYKPQWCRQEFIIMTTLASEWFPLIEAAYGEKAKKVSRFAIKKEPNVFDKEKLNALAENVNEGFTLWLIDEELFDYCRKQEWSRDFISQYTDYETYRKLGLGVVAMKNGVPVSGASSYSSYKDGIEIQIDTKKEYRRQGLATACGARLMLECLERGLYPSWDAQNRWSVALAEKLGYHFDYEYTAYEVTGY